MVNQHMARETIRQLTLESRRFTGPGNTSIERKENSQFIEYYINTMVGSSRLLAITPGYERIRGWCHNYQEEEPMANRRLARQLTIIGQPMNQLSQQVNHHL